MKTRMCFSIFYMGLLLLNTTIFAQNFIEVTGDITENTTWSADTVKVTGNITVADDITLTIDPGTYVEFQGHYKIQVNGILKAVGNQNDSIIFTINDTTGFTDTTDFNGSWNRIRFSDQAGADTSIFQYCIIEYCNTVDHTTEYGEWESPVHISNKSKLIILNSAIRRNLTLNSGTIYCGSSYSKIESCLIEKNISYHWSGGGGIAIGSTNTTINNNIIRQNKAFGNGGGGILVWGGISPAITNNIIINNYSKVLGGGILCYDDSKPYIIQNIICNNTANNMGGGIYFQGSGQILLNNTICNNKAGQGGGICFDYPTFVKGINNIICGNESYQIYVASVSSFPNFNTNLIEGGLSGIDGNPGNVTLLNTIDAVPYFTNPTTGPGIEFNADTADWSLKEESPCINAGIINVFPDNIPVYDIAGETRVKFGYIDLGSYEYSSGILNITESLNDPAEWMADTVKIFTDINVEDLIIHPGVVVQFQGNYGINVYGKLIASGLAQSRILFTIKDTAGMKDMTSQDGGWGPVYLPNAASHSRFSYCNFIYCKSLGQYEAWGPFNGYNVTDIIIDHCKFEKCRGAGYQMNIFFQSSKITFSNNEFYNNTSTNYESWLIRLQDVTNGLIENNQMINNGAGAMTVNNISSIKGNIITNNKCGIQTWGFYAELINNTVCNNLNAAFDVSSAETKIINCISYGNLYADIKYYYIPENLVIKNSLFQRGFLNVPESAILENNLSDIPVFKNPSVSKGVSSDALNTDWSLSEVSACINAGTADTAGLNLNSFDLSGNERIHAGRIDIGALENQGKFPAIILPGIVKQPAGAWYCAGQQVRMNIEVEKPDSVIYKWVKDGMILTGMNTSEIIIDSLTMSDQGNYQCIIKNAYDSIISNSVLITVNEQPTITLGPQDSWAETGKTLTLRTWAKGSNPDFQWQKDGMNITGAIAPEYSFVPKDISDEGAYRCIISNYCGADTTRPAVVYLAPQICMVTVSTISGNNLVVWEKKSKAPLLTYNIYRESRAAGIYDLLGTVPHDELSIFVDTTADPMVQAYLYKITGIDTSGVETDIDLGKPHKTIHLLVSTNPELNTTQLAWDKYYGFDYQTYNIYRSATGTEFEIVHSMASTSNSWTDPDPVADVGFYRIAVEKPVPCIPTGGSKKAESGPYSHSMSNIEDNRLQEVQENQAPTDINLTSNTITENQSVGTLVGRLETTDADTSDHHTYKLVSGSGDQDNNRFTTLGDLLITAEMLDYETKDTLCIRVKSTDKGDLSVEETFTILVTDVNEGAGNMAPTDIALNYNSIDENKPVATLIGKFQTTDPNEEDMHTYGLVEGLGGDDNNSFILLGDALLSGDEFDYETKGEYTIRVRSRDDGDGRLSFEKSFTIYINDLLETGLTDNRIENEELDIYPNPFSNKTVIHFENLAGEKYSMYITDLAGKVVYSEDNICTNHFEFPREELPDGYYFVELRGPKVYRGRMVIE